MELANWPIDHPEMIRALRLCQNPCECDSGSMMSLNGLHSFVGAQGTVPLTPVDPHLIVHQLMEFLPMRNESSPFASVDGHLRDSRLPLGYQFQQAQASTQVRRIGRCAEAILGQDAHHARPNRYSGKTRIFPYDPLGNALEKIVVHCSSKTKEQGCRLLGG
uniref:Uncharacterized protein n=1 Tax=Pseudomonas aeruginosa TaxID=287 RepID=A0A7S6C6Y0_PSEAI|nr:hypothetical protein [Pseudomonas aeruginosa]